MRVDLYNPQNQEIFSQGAEKIKSIYNNKRIFVVHRHLGSILHYDLRIEINGVLKCWALPSGPSMNVGDRRLAVLTEEKPLTYATVKALRKEGIDHGIIESWDKGACIAHSIYSSGCDDQQFLQQFAEGRLRFTLKGKKLKGVFSLVRINNADSKHWLLMKGNDKYAVSYPYNSENYISERSLINKTLKQMQASNLSVAKK